MKNKRSTYLLIAAFIAIWGVVGFRFLKTLNKEDNSTDIANKANFEMKDSGKKQDSFKLIGSYRDPFLGKNSYTEPVKKPRLNPVNNIQKPVKNEVVPEPKKLTETVSVSHLKYYGLIKNQDKGKKVGILYIGNNEYLITENIVLEGVEVKTINEYEIQVNYKEKLFTIEIEE